MAPFKVDVDDRRYCIIQCQKPDTLFKTFDNPEFYNTLYTYLYNYDVSEKYDFVNNLPNTDIKEATRELYKSPFEDFMTNHYEQLLKGWLSADCQNQAFRSLNTPEPKTSYKFKQIPLELIKYCGKAKQLRRDGTKGYYYQLLDCYVDKFKPKEEDLNLYACEEETKDESTKEENIKEENIKEENTKEETEEIDLFNLAIE
jgi:hypothetical protein